MSVSRGRGDGSELSREGLAARSVAGTARVPPQLVLLLRLLKRAEAGSGSAAGVLPHCSPPTCIVGDRPAQGGVCGSASTASGSSLLLLQQWRRATGAHAAAAAASAADWPHVAWPPPAAGLAPLPLSPTSSRSKAGS
jgi:hypothetical protein